MAVTRDEIAEHTAAFPASREELLAAAESNGARLEVITLLETLPDRTFGHLRDVWPYLRQVPLA